ncbi:YncE family protein [Ammoniphilus resinae]|uniref:YVTN family beta-propeller protein n=1 Tax=Ammoniphilus resinae TaxID=861532 RepID=A0ABS4GUY8_9BACL|nr:hypothetical protein [Ammoniphilus resinae]MBP1934078.1 YVTN family beta-propeller protein [Ammoniphilus resinae]
MENKKLPGEPENQIQVIDLWTHEHLFSLPVTEKTCGIALSPNGDRAYLTHHETDQLTIWDTSARTILATISVGRKPKGITLSPDGSRIYVTNSGSRDISIINTETQELEHTLLLDGNPIGISSAENGLLFILTDPTQSEADPALESTPKVPAADPAILNNPLNQLESTNPFSDTNPLLRKDPATDDPTKVNNELSTLSENEKLLNKLPTKNNFPSMPDNVDMSLPNTDLPTMQLPNMDLPNMQLPTNFPALEAPNFSMGDLAKLDLPSFPQGMIPNDLLAGSWNLGTPNALNMIPPLPPLSFNPGNLAFPMPQTLPSNMMLPANLPQFPFEPFQGMNLNMPNTAGVQSLNLTSTLKSRLQRKAQLNKLTHLRQKIRSLGLPDHVCTALEKNLNKAIFHLKTFIKQVKRFMAMQLIPRQKGLELIQAAQRLIS